MGEISPETTYLYARPSLIGGMAHVLDVGGTLQVFNVSDTSAKADTIALRNDWKAVGKDLHTSMMQYEQEE